MIYVINDVLYLNISSRLHPAFGKKAIIVTYITQDGDCDSTTVS